MNPKYHIIASAQSTGTPGNLINWARDPAFVKCIIEDLERLDSTGHYRSFNVVIPIAPDGGLEVRNKLVEFVEGLAKEFMDSDHSEAVRDLANELGMRPDALQAAIEETGVIVKL